METWHVYRLRSDTELLYVGYTRRLKLRLADHRRNKPWWPEVTATQLEEFTTEDQARQREKEIWASESPKYNKQNPFMTTEERYAVARNRMKEWTRDNLARKQATDREYSSDPANRASINAVSRDWARRYRPTTIAGRRLGQRRWRQTGPGLF